MLYTPAALELARRCPIFFSSVGELDKPEMAESTLVSSAVSDAMVMTIEELLRDELMIEQDGCYYS